MFPLLIAHAVAQEAPPIVNGYETSGMPAVGALVAKKGNNGGSICSATLVKINWVITAAHCVTAAEEYEAEGWTIHFVVASDIYGAWDDSSTISRMVIHPDYSYDSNGIDYDIAAMKLTDNIKTVGLMRLNTDQVLSSWKGQDLTYVGFGITDTGKTDAGIKRAVVLPLVEYDGQFVYTIDEGSPLKNICSGDSGGAALMKREQDDKWELVGVNSFVWNNDGSSTIDCGAAGTGAAASRIDRNVDFLSGLFTVEEEVHEGDSDTDSDSDTDTDSDADGDTDSDSDTDVGDSGVTDSGLDGTPTGDKGGGTGVCSPVGAPAWLGLFGLVALARRRPRKP